MEFGSRQQVTSSGADPWHFDVDPDLDPRIHASDWIRILFFTSFFNDNKSKKVT